MKNMYRIGEGELTIEDIERIIKENIKLELSEEAVKRIQKCRDYLDRKMEMNTKPIYGITTGFGGLCSHSISNSDLSTLQENLVKSHACSIGDEVDPIIVKLMFLLKAHALSLGYSGVQVATVQRIIDLYNNDILPIVYDKGSLGASGDLAPLANLFLPLIGAGDVMYKGNKTDIMIVLNELGWKPFDEKLHLLRPHIGQMETALNIRNYLKGSEIVSRHKKHVQDPYSFRCVPQVHGAAKDALDYVKSVVVTEINSVTDNPTIFAEDDEIISGGNFHGEPLAIAYDFLAIALAELGNISERRTAQLILGKRDLP
jgi:histidine ammonia-lyase